MIGKFCGQGIVALALAGFLLTAGPVVTGQTQALAASCASIERDFKRSARPRFLRVVNRNRSLANWYNATLRRIKSGKNPTRKDIHKAYEMMLVSCKSSRNSGKCRAFAKSILGAAQLLYSYNRRWANAGCRGTLSG